MKLSERAFVGVCGALLCGGIALVNTVGYDVVCGWLAIGFAIGAIVDVILAFFGLSSQ